MKFQELLIVLPCHSLEDFPVHHEGEEAAGLLAGWTSLWHPALIDSAQKMPSWARSDDPPETLEGRLLVIPKISQGELPAGWAERAESEGAVVVRNQSCRDEVLSQALSGLGENAGTVDDELAADFLALGFGFLQVELLTRQMRYMSHIDEVYFENETVAAATAAMRGETDEAKSHLTSCFDILAQARDQFYPVDSYLIDLVLVAPTTLGEPLREELRSGAPLSLMVSASVIETMADAQPETLKLLREALERGDVSLVGGEYEEREIALLPLEVILAGFQQGREVYQRHLGTSPEVFGRRRFGLTPMLPQVLHKLGFTGAVHASLDGGRFPQGEQAKIRWEGCDGSAIDALARVPLDSSRAESFLNLSHRIGDSMDMDHVATTCFARWPGTECSLLGDLRRIAAYGPALGKFVTLDTYFQSTDLPDMLTRFEADQYASPHLRQLVTRQQSDPLSRFQQSARRQAEVLAASAMRTMTDVVRKQSNTKSVQGGTTSNDNGASNSVEQAASELATALAGPARSESAGALVLNPASFARRPCVEVSGMSSPPEVVEPVRAAGRRDEQVQAVVDVPAMGFAWFDAGSGSKEGRKKPVPLAAEEMLKNDHFEVVINPTTGALKSLRTFDRRGNQMSVQLAFRAPTVRPRGLMGGQTPMSDPYSVMAADTVEVTAATEAMGEITSRGRLLDRQGKVLSHFEQRFSLWRGSRLLGIEITLDPQVQPGANPWDSYFAARFAWADASADFCRSVASTSQPTNARRLEAPEFVEIRGADGRIAIFPRGLPFHQRSGERMLDTLLIARGETARTFRLAVGVGLSHPMHTAHGLLLDDLPLAVRSPRPSSAASGWLFHVDARNVVATWWEPLWEAGELAGFRARLLETEGRAGRVSLSSISPLAKAVQTDLLGQPLCDLSVEGEKVNIDFAQYEWVQLEARWT